MTRLTWGAGSGESGLSHGVFYPKTTEAVVWDGLASIETTTSDLNDEARYFAGSVYQKPRSGGNFGGAIKAYTYPDSFYTDVLTQTKNVYFGMSWRVDVGDSYEIHLAYNLLLLPTQQEHVPGEPAPFLWNFTSSPVVLPDARRSSHLIINVEIADAEAVGIFEDILYGSLAEDARLPLPEEIFSIFEARATLVVIDHGDGTADIDAPDGVLTELDSTTWQISWISVEEVNAITYEISTF